MDYSKHIDTLRVATSEDAGQASHNTFKLDLANAAYRPATLAQNDRIAIGVVPAGEKLVPHLCQIVMPVIDSNGAPTGDWRIGTTATDNALTGNNAAETAVRLSGEDLSDADIGSKTEPTIIWVKFVNAVATVAPTGVIKAHLVSRPWNSQADG